jgi:hypothetical protein
MNLRKINVFFKYKERIFFFFFFFYEKNEKREFIKIKESFFI